MKTIRGSAARTVARLFLLLIVTCGGLGLPSQAAERFFSAPSRSDFVYSSTRDTLYIVDGGQILRYVASTGQALPTITDPRGSFGLLNIDLSIDERTLAVTDSSFNFQPRVLLVDLDSDIATSVDFALEPNEYGTFGIAWANDGSLLVSSLGFGFFDQPVRRYDPASGTVDIIARVDNGTVLRANSDRSVVAIETALTPDGSTGFARYAVSDRSLIYSGQGIFFGNVFDMVPNRDASQYALVSDIQTRFTDGALLLKSDVLGNSDRQRPLSAAYDPARDVLYAPWSGTRQVRAFDTSTFAEIGRFILDLRFPSFAFGDSSARTRVSADGEWLFANVDGGVIGVPTDDIEPALTPDPADLPTVSDGELTTREDESTFIFLPGNDPTNSNFPDYELGRLPANGSVEFFGGNFATYTPNPDFFGTDSFTFTLSNEAGTSEEATITVTVTPINDAPSYSLNRQLYRTLLGGLRRTDRDAVLDIRPGPANESGQQVGFAVSNNNPALFIEQPRISPDGVLIYRPRLFGRGEATVTVTGIDTGGSADGGTDRGPTMSFRIDVR